MPRSCLIFGVFATFQPTLRECNINARTWNWYRLKKVNKHISPKCWTIPLMCFCCCDPCAQFCYRRKSLWECKVTPAGKSQTPYSHTYVQNPTHSLITLWYYCLVPIHLHPHLGRQTESYEWYTVRHVGGRQTVCRLLSRLIYWSDVMHRRNKWVIDKHIYP